MQIKVNKEDFSVSAEKFNLDPRDRLVAALQPLWTQNQKLELLRIAFEVLRIAVPWAHQLVSASKSINKWGAEKLAIQQASMSAIVMLRFEPNHV